MYLFFVQSQPNKMIFEYIFLKFPINSCRIIEQPEDRKEIIEKFAGTAYPVIHERVLWLYSQFLEHKFKDGKTLTKKFSIISLFNYNSILKMFRNPIGKRPLQKHDNHKFRSTFVG